MQSDVQFGGEIQLGSVSFVQFSLKWLLAGSFNSAREYLFPDTKVEKC